MIQLLVSPLIKLVAGQAIEKIATELIEHKPSENKEENAAKVAEVIKSVIVPFWKQKKFYLMILAGAILILNHFFGLGIPIESLVCSL